MDLAAFAGYTVAHPHLAAADRDLRALLRDPGDAALLFLFGPSGVGKSTLLGRVERVLVEEATGRMAAEPGFRPFVAVDAQAPTSGGFSWGGLYQDLLEAIAEPGIDQKTDPDRALRRAVGRRRASAADLRRAFVGVVRTRRIPAVIIDEAHHIGIVGSGRRLVDELDHLKGLADACGAPIVLAGTYRLEAFRNLSDQLGRRSRDVHLSRYRRDDADEFAVFAAVAEHLAERLPLPLRATRTLWPFLYEGSAGCVGPLRNWLARAAANALDDEDTRITRAHLLATRMSGGTLLAMVQAIVDGERAMAEDDHKRERAGILLGGATLVSSPAATTQIPVTATRRRRVPGRRGPHRDPVGPQPLPGAADAGA